MPRTRSLAWAELKIGLVSIFAIVMASILIFLVTGSGGFFWQRYSLKTVFSNIAGLKTGAPVRLAGVEIGSVSDLNFVGDRVEVELQIRKEHQPRITNQSTVGGSPESVVRAAHHGLPLMLAIISGSPQRFVGYSDLYRQMLERFEKPTLPIGVHSPGHVADTDEQAKEDLWPHYAGLMNRIGAERGWQPIGRAHFEREAAEGALFVGAPETVAAKIVKTVKALGLSRFDLKYSNGTMPHDKLMKSIELYGTRVVPLVKEQLQSETGETEERDDHTGVTGERRKRWRHAGGGGPSLVSSLAAMDHRRRGDLR